MTLSLATPLMALSLLPPPMHVVASRREVQLEMQSEQAWAQLVSGLPWEPLLVLPCALKTVLDEDVALVQVPWEPLLVPWALETVLHEAVALVQVPQKAQLDVQGGQEELEAEPAHVQECANHEMRGSEHGVPHGVMEHGRETMRKALMLQRKRLHRQPTPSWRTHSFVVLFLQG